MQHDLKLARAVAPRPSVNRIGVGRIIRGGFRAALTTNSFDGICLRLGAVAFFLVPGRFLIVSIWPASAHYLGFGS
jgi:hypothetical protein